MPALEKAYQSKLTTPAGAANYLPKRGNLSFAMAIGQPPAIIEAIGKRVRSGDLHELRLYYMHAEEPVNQHLLQYELMDIVKPCPAFVGAQERALMKQGAQEGRAVVFYVPNSFSQVPGYFERHIELDVFVATVSPMDSDGYFSLGTNNDYSSTASRSAKKLIVEVNEHMPRVYGDSRIHVSEVDAIVENNQALLEIEPRPPTAADHQITQQIAELIPDGATLQMGIGGIPDALCAYLKNHKDLGIHTELLSPGIVDLIRCGAATGKRKNLNPGKHVFTFAMGNHDMYEFMNNNPSIESYPVNYVNDPAVISQNDQVVSVNSIIEIDLYGQVNAEQIEHRQFTGAGGQNDFVRGAFASNSGKSILAFESTAKGQSISKIVPRLENVVTDLRMDTQYVCTEYGLVNLKGLTTAERAEKLIELAHPKFREALEASAKDLLLL